ncbi:hypothetical protein N7532_010572 [Penicillium argentinense]|uniref:2EXR domain-containing protein n=1 Tax=Penicillium argentinense TaxID=1131581 RepID=A0A9W9JYA0_9EURO|nr:uncharacterized protein N7532_010572 [Penicillium argentinense]KAJ5085801.1 hypothetical protein N7532_010572 [Penicillium argentinense]
MLSFLNLPPEIRLIIYAYSLNPNEYVSGYRKIELLAAAEMDRARGPVCAYPRPYIERNTPAILLLNRKITKEALEVLYKIPLNLYSPPPTYFVMRRMDITEFIGEPLLQRIQHGVLRLDDASKHFISTLLDIWGKANSLQSLHVYRSKHTPSPPRHWKVVEDRLRTFSESSVPITWHRVDDPLKADYCETTEPPRPSPLGKLLVSSTQRGNGGIDSEDGFHE